MQSSIAEIASSARHATEVVTDAVVLAGKTGDAIRDLERSTMEIRSVVDLISSIAEQTNLLALNASIEAARAGDAGKGFAVVAGEVKSLATETAKATSAVSTQIENIQRKKRLTIVVIGEIQSVIESVNTSQSTISDSLNHQSDLTPEIVRTTELCVEVAHRISELIPAVANNASTTNSAAKSTVDVANSFAQSLESGLNSILTRFGVKVDRAPAIIESTSDKSRPSARMDRDFRSV
jgi:methyl-accepting chemotaxis protein